jgi:hypothetical protein
MFSKMLREGGWTRRQFGLGTTGAGITAGFFAAGEVFRLR